VTRAIRVSVVPGSSKRPPISIWFCLGGHHLANHRMISRQNGPPPFSTFSADSESARRQPAVETLAPRPGPPPSVALQNRRARRPAFASTESRPLHRSVNPPPGQAASTAAGVRHPSVSCQFEEGDGSFGSCRSTRKCPSRPILVPRKSSRDARARHPPVEPRQTARRPTRDHRPGW